MVSFSVVRPSLLAYIPPQYPLPPSSATAPPAIPKALAQPWQSLVPIARKRFVLAKQLRYCSPLVLRMPVPPGALEPLAPAYVPPPFAERLQLSATDPPPTAPSTPSTASEVFSCPYLNAKKSNGIAIPRCKPKKPSPFWYNRVSKTGKTAPRKPRMTTKEAAALLKVSDIRVRQLCREGRLPYTFSDTKKKSYILKLEDVEEFSKVVRLVGRPSKPQPQEKDAV